MTRLPAFAAAALGLVTAAPAFAHGVDGTHLHGTDTLVIGSAMAVAIFAAGWTAARARTAEAPVAKDPKA